MRRVLPFAAVAAVAAIVVLGLTQAGSQRDSGEASARTARFDLQKALRSLRGAPAPLAALHAQSAKLLPATPRSFRARLRGLRGHPVVINKWASWCGPCRHEFPSLQRVATSHGKRIAFVGLDSGDSRAEAREFLRDFPVPYPSYEDPDERIARAIGAPANYPITVLLDERGELAFIRQGGYASVEQLETDIERYLG